ncbi:MAG: curli-like amyloid fiber formation chaperone CsgH [Hyphomonadaceae bacterium]
MRSLLFVGLAMLGACAASAAPSAETVAAEAPALVAPAETAPLPRAAPAAAAARSAPVAESAPLARADLDCAIVRTRTSHGVELRAVASSDARIAGEYEFVITKRDRAGSSDITQAGEFALDGDSASLGTAEVSVARGGGYDARLELTGFDGETCVAEASR